MITQVEKVNELHPEEAIIEKAADILRRGGLVAFPTETVYGLGADALLAEGAKNIYAAKGRPSDNPLIVHIARWEDLYKIAVDIPPQAKALADAFWPGPLTMIFKKSETVPYETTGGLDTVAVRMPSHPVALALIRQSGGFLAAPSANTSGRPSPTRASHVAEDLDGRIPLILDGGAVGIGIESTIVDVSFLTKDAAGAWNTDELPMILRPGYITHAMLSDVIGAVCDDPGFAPDSTVRPKAPGMKYKHYAPKADILIVAGEEAAVAAHINACAKADGAQGIKTGVLCTDQTKTAYVADVVKSMGDRRQEVEIMQNLYAFLREFDALGVQQIYAESFADLEAGGAIMNRLLKAAGYRMVSLPGEIESETKQ